MNNNGQKLSKKNSIRLKKRNLSPRLRALREQYFDWLVSIESDKFRSLESVGVPVSLAKSSSNSNGSLVDDDYSEDGNQEGVNQGQEEQEQQVER